MFAEDFFAGRAALTMNASGQGAAYYLATKLAPADLAGVLDGVCARAKVGPVLGEIKVPAEVEVTVREKEGARFLFLLNHGATAVSVTLPAGWTGVDLLTGKRVGRAATVGALGVRVVAVGS